MTKRVRARIIRIGNSQGVRIPKVILEQSGLYSEVELEVGEDRITIHKAQNPREGWEEAYRAMTEQGDDELLDEIVPTDWDSDEWEW